MAVKGPRTGRVMEKEDGGAGAVFRVVDLSFRCIDITTLHEFFPPEVAC